MPTQCKPLSFAFQGCQGRRVAAAFDGGAITSNAGVLLLREIDRSAGLLDQVAGCFTDYRDPRLTEHSVGTLVRQRVMGITLGYEDLNDHDQLRHDPVLALLSGKLGGHRKDCAPLAGKSTLNRLEHAPPSGEPGRYHRIGHDADALQAVLLESFIDSWKGGRPSRLVLDIDATDDEVHGRQEGRFFHGYYGHYCFLPLYITCGGRPLFAQLRPGNADPAGGVTGPLGRIVERLRERVAGTGDPASGRCLLCPRGDPGLVRGQRRGLRHRPGPELAARRDDRLGAGRRPGGGEAAGPPSPPVQGVPLRHTHKLVPQAPGRRQGRAPARQGQPALRGHLAARHPSRPGPSTSASTARGATWRTRSRSSSSISSPTGPRASRFAANQLRILFSAFASILFSAFASILFSAFASILFVALRRALHGTRLARATAGNAAAQAPQDRRPRHGLGAKGQGRHGLRTPVGRRLRTRPRPIARVTTPHLLRDTRSSRSSGDHCAAGPKKARSGSGSRSSGPPKTRPQSRLLLLHLLPRQKLGPQRCPQSPQR